MKNRYICLDTETTGLSPINGDKIIEIGCVEIIDNKITNDKFHSYINPQKEISKESTRITNITNEMVKNSPIFSEISNDFINFLLSKKEYSTFLIIHNANFDLKFLYNELNQKSITVINSLNLIDTLKVARKLFPNEKANLDSLCKRFEINLKDRQELGHGALLDANLLAQLFIKLLEIYSIEKLTEEKKYFFGFRKREMEFKRRNPCEITNKEEELHIKLLSDINVDIW